MALDPYEVLYGSKATEDSLPPEIHNPPDSNVGEFASGFSRGIDSVQKMWFKGGEFVSTSMGWEAEKNYFQGKVRLNAVEITNEPSGVPTLQDITGPFSLSHYCASQLGQGLPLILLAVTFTLLYFRLLNRRAK